MAEFKGVLSRVSEDGIAYLVDQESARTFPFTFDKISGYRGEPARKLGFVAGAAVGYGLDANGHVEEVALMPQPKKAWAFFRNSAR